MVFLLLSFVFCTVSRESFATLSQLLLARIVVVIAESRWRREHQKDQDLTVRPVA